jgi:hypothetical protein
MLHPENQCLLHHRPLSLSYPLLLFGSGWIELLPLLSALPYSTELTAVGLLPNVFDTILNLIFPRELDPGCDLLLLIQDKMLFLGHGQRVVFTPLHCYTYSIHILLIRSPFRAPKREF